MTLKANRSERRSVGRREKLRGRVKAVRDILAAHERGVSVRGIALSTGCSVRFVRRVLELGEELGLLSDEAADQDADQGEGVGRK